MRRTLRVQLAHFNLEVEVYPDSIELFFRKLPNNFLTDVRRLYDKLVPVAECKDKDDHIWGYRVYLQQPSSDLLRYLAKLQWRHHFWVHRVDWAFDFITASKEKANEVREFLRQHVILRYRRKDFMRVYGGVTVYWADADSARNLAL